MLAVEMSPAISLAKMVQLFLLAELSASINKTSLSSLQSTRSTTALYLSWCRIFYLSVEYAPERERGRRRGGGRGRERKRERVGERETDREGETERETEREREREISFTVGLLE